MFAGDQFSAKVHCLMQQVLHKAGLLWLNRYGPKYKLDAGTRREHIQAEWGNQSKIRDPNDPKFDVYHFWHTQNYSLKRIIDP